MKTDLINENTSEQAVGIAARCWCDDDTKHIVMEPALAMAFAKRVQGMIDHLELAWGLIANASGGDWEKESREWQDAAIRWRDMLFGSQGDA